MSADRANPAPLSTRDPDLRAIFHPGRFLLVPWGEAIDRLDSLLYSRPGGPLAFELWDEGNQWLARQHGIAPAEPAIDALSHWARERGSGLRIGASLGPRCRERGRAIRVASDPVTGAPAFRFVYPGTVTGARRLRIAPWGYTDDPTGSLRRPWHGAAGEVVQFGPDHGLARFAHLDPGWLDVANSALLAWALEDGRRLEVAPGLHDLGEPGQPPETHFGTGICADCGDQRRTGVYSHLGFYKRGWISTRCGICGGRYRWHR